MKQQGKSEKLVNLFLELAQPNEEGFSRDVSIEEFVGKYSELSLGNGSTWCREDNAGILAKKYNIVKTRVNPEKDTGKIIAVRLNGFNTNHSINNFIKSDIRKKLQNEKCRVLNTSNPEIDHKDGRKDDFQGLLKENQTLEMFQPLHRNVNLAKRQHCKNCRNTNIRFDAKLLGYSVSQFVGKELYEGTCIGCYWYDPKEFNEKVSKSYNKENS